MVSPRVLIVGDVMDDVVAVISRPLRPDTDTPARVERTSGGSAANTAVWLAQESVAVDFVGRVGEADCDRFTTEFRSAGVSPYLEADAEQLIRSFEEVGAKVEIMHTYETKQKIISTSLFYDRYIQPFIFVIEQYAAQS